MPETFDFGQESHGPGARWPLPQEPTNRRGLAYAPWPLRVVGGFVDYVAPFLLLNWLADHTSGDAIATIGIFVWVAYMIFNLIIAQGLSGRTFGKFFMGIRCCALITTAHGDEYCQFPGIGVAFVRTFGHVIDIALPWGWLRPLWQQDARTFGDSIAGTVIVVSRKTQIYTAKELAQTKHIGGRYGW